MRIPSYITIEALAGRDTSVLSPVTGGGGGGGWTAGSSD
jgi:hypothetical protein